MKAPDSIQRRPKVFAPFWQRRIVLSKVLQDSAVLVPVWFGALILPRPR